MAHRRQKATLESLGWAHAGGCVTPGNRLAMLPDDAPTTASTMLLEAEEKAFRIEKSSVLVFREHLREAI